MEIDVMRDLMVKRRSKDDAINLCELYRLYEDKKRVIFPVNYRYSW